ncbi:MAG TPA: hypothetical protein VN973_06040 [Candidatus Dormibacteraeota bacterium]|nr:hypothetical protein [Candidatus Dormibacteraeota bacterium]
MIEPLKSQAARAIAAVVEAECPLCKVELWIRRPRVLSLLWRQLRSQRQPP